MTLVEKLYIGIDPGLDGAVGVIRELASAAGSYILSVKNAPSTTIAKSSGRKARHLDPHDMAEMVDGWFEWGQPQIVAVEQAQSSPKMGVTSAFNYGCGYGLWQGILAARKISFVTVRPQEWMAVMFAGMGSRDKALSRTVAHRLFPTADLDRVKDHGRAEALLIAEWARRRIK